jgi:uracil-DNA glycosylase
MTETANPRLVQDIAAAFAWWREAGVDCAFQDEPADWIAAPPAAKSAETATPAITAQTAARPEPPPQPSFDLASAPTDIKGFCTWWQAEPWLDQGRVSGRVPPRGAAGADLMIVVPEPERDDRETLLSGPQGNLVETMMAAMGISPDRAYIASALPRHTPMADWTEAGQRGLGEVLRHHVALVAPQRLIAFGNNVLPLLGHDLPNSSQILSQFNHGEISIPLMSAMELGALLSRPRAKRKIWSEWLDWR